MASATRGSRRFVAASLVFLLCWQAAVLAGGGRALAVVLGLYGFVFHTVFGKAYALLPSYFDRTLAPTWAPAVQLPLSVLGVVALAVGRIGPAWLTAVGSVLWAGGVAVFLGALGWTIRDNPTGRETGTGGVNDHRRPIDRLGNAAMPVALLYLGVGSAVGVAELLGTGPPLAISPPAVAHLLAAGGAALLVFGVGFRLFPRFLVASPPRPVVALVLLAGAAGPALLAIGVHTGSLLPGAVAQSVAVAGFGTTYLGLFARSTRRRVGFVAVAVAAVAGISGVAIGLRFAVVGVNSTLIAVHYRLLLLGFLGLTVVGAAFQFYPPSVGDNRFATDRTAAIAIAALTVGLAGQTAGIAVNYPLLTTVGEMGTILGAAIYTFLVAVAFRTRPV